VFCRVIALNTALFEFAAERCAAAPLLLSAGDCYRSISPVCRALNSKLAARRC